MDLGGSTSSAIFAATAVLRNLRILESNSILQELAMRMKIDVLRYHLYIYIYIHTHLHNYKHAYRDKKKYMYYIYISV